MSLKLNCLIEGEPIFRVFTVTLDRDCHVSELREEIIKILKERKRDTLKDADPQALEMWKAEVNLNDNVDQRAIIQLDPGSQKLMPWKSIAHYWPSQLEPADGHLHVVVKLPSAAQSVSRKRRRVEYDGAEEIGDAKGVGPSSAYSRPSSPMIEQITAIHNAIMGLPDAMDFSNPTMLTTLPFPSPLRISFQRFAWSNQDNVMSFSYMGRSKFTELYEHIQGPAFQEGLEEVYLYGTSGSGKSHILAALVCRLIREGKRVVYVPDCTLLIKNFTIVIRSALRFAFHDSEPHLKTIESASTEDLVTFWARERDVYFVVDQLNALELGGRSINLDNVKRDVVIGYLCTMTLGHKYIFSASANEQSNREAVAKQSGVTVISMNGGMTQDETNHWFINHSAKLPPLSKEDRQLVEHQTGRIPLLLRALFDDNKKFDYGRFMTHNDLRKVHDDVFDFYIQKQKELSEDEKDIYFAIMDACLQSDTVEHNMQELYDLRYFYIDPDRTGHYTCGVVFEAMMSLYRKRRLSRFCGDEWYSAVRRSSGNPVVQGFLAEHICLSRIVSCGLLVVSPDLDRMSHTSFDAKPIWDAQLSSAHTRLLYIPTAYNFRAVDAAILLVDKTAKTAHIYLIQFTLSMRHKLSDEDFYQAMWWKWVEPLEEVGYSVESTFVWIDKKQPENRIEPELVKEFRSTTKIVRPEYHSIHIGIEQVDQKLARVLGL